MGEKNEQEKIVDKRSHMLYGETNKEYSISATDLNKKQTKDGTKR